MVKRSRMKRKTRLFGLRRPDTRHLKPVEEKVKKVHGEGVDKRRVAVAIAGLTGYGALLPFIFSRLGLMPSVMIIPMIVGVSMYARGSDLANVKDFLKYEYNLKEKEAHDFARHIEKEFKDFKKHHLKV